MESNHLLADDYLLHQLQTGDQHAFELLFRRHYPRLLDFLRILGAEREVAEDAVQDLFVEIWVKRDKLSIHSSLKAYLYTAAKNRFFTHQKSVKPAGIESAEMVGASLSSNPAHQLVTAEMKATFERELQELPLQARQAFTLRVQGARQKEIAAEMGISENTVEKHLGNARKKLKVALIGFLD